MRTPHISNARVLAVDVPNRRLTVSLPSTQIVSVRMSYDGPADGLRVSHKAMPGRGTEGIVVFPAGDNRNGFWLRSIYTQAMDALTTETDQFLEYDSHWSGHYRILDQHGNKTESYADGSFLQVGAGTVPPATSRHTVDTKQFRQVTAVPQDQRVPNPPPPFNFTLKHISGTTAAIDPIGNTNVTGAASAAKMTVNFGGTNLQIDKTGNVTLLGASSATLNIIFGQASIQIDAQGNVSIVAPGVSIGAFDQTLHTLLTSLAAVVYNAHSHSGGGSGPPTPQMTAVHETSTLVAG